MPAVTAEPARNPTLSIYDLAKHLGISSGTVSRALNNRPDVSPATRQRVLAAAVELGFSPSPLARGLARNRSQAVGVIIPSIDDPFFLAFARGVQEAVSPAGLAVVLSFADTREALAAAVKSFVDFRAAGILVLGGSAESDEHVAALSARTPLVVALRKAHHAEFSSVFVDHEAGARAMVELLRARGRNNIAFVSLPLASQAAQERMHGYRGAARYSDPAFTVVAAGSGFLDGANATAELLSRPGAESIDALFYASDALAAGGLHVLSERGIVVPDSIAVAGFGDIDSSAVTVPSLTTARVPMYEVGERAASLLIDLIEGHTVGAEDVELPLEVVERKSTQQKGSTHAAP